MISCPKCLYVGVIKNYSYNNITKMILVECWTILEALIINKFIALKALKGINGIKPSYKP